MSDIISLLDSVLGTHKKFANSEYYYRCPDCNKPKLAVNLFKMRWHCWVCDAKGRSFFSLFKKLNCSTEQMNELRSVLGEYIPKNEEIQLTTNLSLPKEYVPLWEYSNKIDFKHAKNYLAKRNIFEEDIIRYEIGYCPEGPFSDRIIIPSFDAANKLNYFIGRSFYDEVEARYKNPTSAKNIIMFESQVFFDSQTPIVLCEGVFDAIAIRRNAIPLLGKFPSPALLEKISTSNIQEIYLALDKDALKETLKIAEDFIANNRKVYLVVLAGKDPSELGFQRVNEMIGQAKEIDFLSLIKLKVS